MGTTNKKERKKIIKEFRKLFRIEYKPGIDDGEVHGPQEAQTLAIIENLLDADYNCFDDFIQDLIFYIRDEQCGP